MKYKHDDMTDKQTQSKEELTITQVQFYILLFY